VFSQITNIQHLKIRRFWGARALNLCLLPASILGEMSNRKSRPTTPFFGGTMRMWKATILSILAISASAASGGALQGTVLYPLTLPNGFSDIFQDDAAGGQVVGSGYGSATGEYDHALLWSGTASSAVDLNPSGFTQSYAFGTTGGQQVGYGEGSATGGNNYALLWTGTASSAVDLNPTGFTQSYAFGTSGGQQVGRGITTGGNSDALLWSGTASSAVDLNPTGFTLSGANGTDGSQQVGYGWGSATGNNRHALLWSGTASSAVDLNPTGFTQSYASGTSGGQQVGYGEGSATGGNNHALLWTGTASSAVDLNPSGFVSSGADGTNGSQQVGSGYGPPTESGCALLWSGTAASAVDLQSLLPATGSWNWSNAFSIDSSGDVFGDANGTYNDYTGVFAVEWSTAIPEPATSSLLLVASAGTLLRRVRPHPIRSRPFRCARSASGIVTEPSAF
jgi:hypothetical protein